MTRLITFSDGDGMGDFQYVARTNAPAKVLKDMGQCDSIWADVLNSKGYDFEIIDEHQHVTAYSTSKSWLEEKYSQIAEFYTVE